MPNRTAKFASAIFVSFLAGAPLAILSHGAARAADDCVAAPKDVTPEGSHWYYRIDHATKRHCWYLRTEGERLSQTAPPNSSPATNPIAPRAETPAQRSIADAHAELPAQTTIEPTRHSDAPVFAMPAGAPVREDSAAAEPQRSVVASRWPEPSDMNSAPGPRPATDNLAANTQPESTPAASPAVAAVTLAAADASPQTRSGSIPKLLSVIAGALALAGITASLVLKFGGARRRTRIRARRHKIWQPTDDGSIALSARRDTDVVPRRTGLPRDLDRTDDANDRIAEFFSQLSKRAQN
jgi:hypothetical protein